MGQTIVYGVGGLDTSKPNDNIVSVETYDDIPEAAEQLTISTNAIETFLETLDDPTVNSISEIKAALKDFLNELKEG